MEYGSSQPSFSLEKAPSSTRPPNRRLLRKKMVKQMLDSGSDDDDVMMMENTGLQKPVLSEEDRFQQLLGQQKTDVSEEQRQDNLLKELGLYEEGMSKEQKQELLLVIEASKETAEKEETMRNSESVEWPIDVLLINGKTKDAKKCFDPSNSRSSSTSQEGKKTNLVTVGDSDEDTRMTPSQDLFPSLHSDPEQLQSQEKMPDQEEDSLGSFPAGQQVSESSVFKSLENSTKPARWTYSRISRKRGSQSDRRISAMETVMTVWTSPFATAVVTSLVRNSKINLSDEVPYFCPHATKPSLYTKAILRNMNNYHISLLRMQRRASESIPWGDPVLLGKSRLLGQHRSRDVPSTLAEEPPDEQAQTLPDLEGWPVGHLEVCPVTEAKPVQISETSKKDESAEDVFVALNRGCSVQDDDSNKKSSHLENEVCGDDEHQSSESTSVRRLRLSSASDSEFEMPPPTVDDDMPKDGVITGGGMPTPDRVSPEIKPKQLRKRNKCNEPAADSKTVGIRKKSKRQVKDKFSHLVKR